MVEKKVIELVSGKFGINRTKITKNTTFKKLEASFFDIYELLLLCEKEYMIDIDDEITDTVKTIHDFVSYIESVLHKE